MSTFSGQGHKWYAHLIVGDIINARLSELNLQYPSISQEHQILLQEARHSLEAEET
jgi:hypothetical protein